MDLKRLNSDATVSSAEQPAAKRHSVDKDNSGPITPEDIELFQKEAILRQMNVYRRERDALKSELAAVNGSQPEVDLRNQLETLASQFSDISRKLERSTSDIVARCTKDNGSKTSNGEGKSESSKDSKPVQESGDGSNQDPTPQQTVDSAQIQAIQEKLAAAEAASTRLEIQLKEEISKGTALESRNRELQYQNELAPVSANSLTSRISELTKDNMKLDTEARATQKRLLEVQATQAEYEQQVRDRYDLERQSLDRKLLQTESDLARIRAARDELVGEINVAKAAASEQEKELTSLKQLIDSVDTSKSLNSANNDGGNATPPAENDVSKEIAALNEIQDLAALRDRAIKLTRQNKALAGEITGLEQAFGKANARARESAKSQANAEHKLATLATAKARADEKYFGAMRSRDAQNLELSKVKQALMKSGELAGEFRARESQLTGQISKLQRQLSENAETIRAAERRAVEADRLRLETLSRIATTEKSLEVAKSQIAQQDAVVKVAEQAKRNAEIAADKSNRQLETQKAITGAGSPSEIREQLESLRSIAICGVCQKNWKDTALTTCGHVLCSDCVKSRLAARMRKCPMCNQQFQQSDVLEVHL